VPRLIAARHRWLALLLLLLAMSWPVAAPAANPLAPRDERPASAAAPAAPGPVAALGAALAKFNRVANREIARNLRAIRDGEPGAPLLIGLGLAFIYGVLHALGPGHGKLVIVGYFLGRQARIGRGLVMGTQIAIFHVISAILVVALADLLLRRGFGGAPAEAPAVRLVSYGLILVIGLWMLVRAVRRERHGADHIHDAACGCTARPAESGLLSLGVGMVPCTGALLVMLYALANDILLAGVMLVTAIAAGMAITMGALGLLAVLGRGLVAERLGGGSPMLVRTLDVGGAVLVILVGAALMLGTLGLQA
jgi:nickel/cobalt exporter